MAKGKKKQKTIADQNFAVVYRLNPTKDQKTEFYKTFGCCRKVWNLMLAAKKEHYANTKENLQVTPAQFKKEHPYLKEVDSLALANEQQNLQRAFTAFFRARKKGRKVGYPKFKSRRRGRKSYTTNCVNGNIEVLQDGIRLPKIGVVKAKIHRVAPEGYTLKSVTICEKADGHFYASVLYEYSQGASHRVKTHIAFDYTSDGLYVDSNGQCADMPHYYRKGEKKLAKEQRKLSGKVGAKKGETPSKNYLKQKEKVAKVHRHIANQRNDFLHKQSTAITKQYDLVTVEDLNLSGMSRGLHLGKAVHDNGYGKFVNMLEYKQKREGHFFVKVDRFFPSSQTCSVCGGKNPQMKNLKNRTLVCTHCGAEIDRDWNAAINIDKEGQRILFSP